MDVTVWWAVPGSVGPDLLTPVESARREALRQPADRDRFTTGAVLLRLAVAARTGLAPAAVPVRRDCPRCGRPHGRPTIDGYDVHVSISHSGERVAVALADVPLGVDVELVRPIGIDDLVTQTLGPGERAEDIPAFFRYWVRKESAVKATGDGLQVPLGKVRVSRPDEPARLLGYPDRPGLVATMRDLDAGTGYAAALTVLAPELGTVSARWVLPDELADQ
jgi:4'-phosphopantetheinyl transferase